MRNPQILDLYSDYCLTSFDLITSTGLSKLVDKGYSHDQISRFLSQREFTQKDFWKMVKPIVRKVESENGIISIDDTISEKPHSTENEMICYHWDHSKGRNIKGINILNFVYQADLPNKQDVSIPIAFEIIKKTESYYDTKSQKNKRRSPVTKNELVRERLEIITNLNKIKYRYIVWDTWFSSKQNLDFVHNKLKKHFVVALKSNRLVALSEQDKKQGKFQKIESLEFQSNRTIQVWLKGVDFPTLAVKQVFMNKDGSTGELFLISNDLSLDASDLIAIYQKR